MHFFLTDELTDPLVLRGDEHHHSSRVLRLKVGERILVGDGGGDVVEAVIEDVGREETRCRADVVHRRFNEPFVEITLLQGVLKNPSKMDWLLEKGTELGMTSFIPLMTERTVPHGVKTDRLRKLTEAATKQCLRGRIPDIAETQVLTEVLDSLDGMRLLVFHEQAPGQATPEALTLDERPLALFVGPEGGFSESEIDLFRARGAHILSLGPRRLRGETAALAALARVNGVLERLRISDDG